MAIAENGAPCELPYSTSSSEVPRSAPKHSSPHPVDVSRLVVGSPTAALAHLPRVDREKGRLEGTADLLPRPPSWMLAVHEGTTRVIVPCSHTPLALQGHQPLWQE